MNLKIAIMTSKNIAPTKKEIEERLKTLLPTLAPEDTIVVAFSGHGVMVDASGTGAKRSYLCPSDVNPKVASILAFEKTLVSRRDVDELLNACPARSKVLICDACRSEDLKAEDFVAALETASGQKGGIKSVEIEYGFEA